MEIVAKIPCSLLLIGDSFGCTPKSRMWLNKLLAREHIELRTNYDIMNTLKCHVSFRPEKWKPFLYW